MAKTKQKVGRPTKYTPELIQEVDNYLAEVPPNQLPKLVSFAIRIGVNQETLTEWEKIHPEFSVSLNKIRSQQHQQLIDDGIYNPGANSTIVKLLLQNNFGYKDKESKEITGANGGDLIVKFD
jgi:hypothetical protein